jgi:ketol-acid reductoisomerase
MIKVYYDNDADLGLLKDKTIAIIGYGIQGRGQALNLRDSGCKVVVADLPDSPNWKQAVADGMNPIATPEAAAKGHLIQILTEDHVQAAVYRSQIAPHVAEGNALIFSHGFNIHYHQIVPPPTVDVFMVAPKGPGSLVRSLYEQGRGVPGLLAVHQDYTGKAKELGLAYAKGIGCTRAGLIETTFKEETETDLFGEQAVLCGGVTELIKAGFDVLVEAGYQPESAYLEVCHELKLIVDIIHQHGIQGMRKRVSDTAEYGDMTRGTRVIDERVRGEMRKLLREVQSGEFAREWILENQAGRPVFKALEAQQSEHLLEQVGAQLREMMPWLTQK